MKKFLILTIIICCTLGFSLTVYGAEVDPNVKALQEADKHIQGVERAGNLFTGADLNGIVGNIIFGLMGIIGVIALLFFIYGGIMWMTSEGVDTVLQKAQKTMIWAAIGLVAVFLSYAVVVQVFTFSEELFTGEITVDPANPGAFDDFDEAIQRANNWEPVNIDDKNEILYNNALEDAVNGADPRCNDPAYPMSAQERVLLGCPNSNN